jgi:excisionase family DNA binding protein
MPNQFLFLEEVAAETRATLSTVRHWIAVGKLPSVRPGRRRLVRRIDLERFLEASSAGSPAVPEPSQVTDNIR